MKKLSVFILAVVIAAALLIGSTTNSSAGGTRTDFTATEYVCAPEPPEMWIGGNVMHIRDYKHINVNVSDSPLHNGLNTTMADADINMKTGIAIIRGTFSIRPEGIDGTWEGTWVFNGTPGVGFVRGRGVGTGELAGKLIFLEVYDLPPNPDLNEEMCAGIGAPEGIEKVEGYILEP